jgi:hypothetical protein
VITGPWHKDLKVTFGFGHGLEATKISTGNFRHDGDLLDIEEAELRVQFDAADLAPVQICHPKLLLKAMAPKR